MAAYRKKPMIVDAVQFDFGADVWPDGVERANAKYNEKDVGYGYIETLGGETLVGRMQVADGDWIITDAYGGKYPCKDDIFKRTYEQVEDHL